MEVIRLSAELQKFPVSGVDPCLDHAAGGHERGRGEEPAAALRHHNHMVRKRVNAVILMNEGLILHPETIS